ncbi:LapA family protein [Nostoc sp. FACHB-888]|uniref:LapA family protein n=1 Tax=Nostoc sp. FACHB-888 TaxID=2692842 RepID=UPI0016843C2D|nr:LapA family protein [Nostoc sp. FACHB-888]MBD2246214.1 LapA family protein [Nostoc sp. FACHB-888]
MKTFAPFLTTLIIAIWVIAIAIISVQNATPVSLKFLTFQSIQIPMGLLLAFSACVGLIGMALLQPLWGLASFGQRNSRLEDDAEFFVDDEDF